MLKKIHMLTYFIVVFSLLSVGYTGSYFSDIETSINCSFTAADDWLSTIPCTRTLGYWKNHDEAWPADEITIGETTYTKQEAIDIMWIPGAGDKTYDMFKQLIVAKLNVLISCNSRCIEQTITDADAWMYDHPVGSGVPANSQAWQEGGGGLLHFTLDQYNNGLLCAPHCNSPPYEPTNPMPYNDATGVGINPTLSVYVSDPNNDTMNVSFYDASDDSLIDTVTDVESNTTVSVVWLNLDYGVTYGWYIIAEDYEGPTQSDTWCFTAMASSSRGGGGSEGGNSGGGSPPSNNPPMANAGGPYSGYVNETIAFDGSGSTDDGTITSYLWDFGDGTNTTEINATVTHRYTDVGTYNVALTVTDNDGATDTNTTTVTIAFALEINNITATPSSQTIGECVNITCSITNTSPVVDVVLNINYPNNNSTSPSIYQNNIENSTTYYLNQTYNLLGIYEYYIWAYDIENRTAMSGTYQFSITNSTDVVPPEISNISANPEEQEINGYINISATVTDGDEVKDVFLNITYPDNSASNITMTCIDGTVTYYYNSTYPNYGEYVFFIFANDMSNNTVTSNMSRFSIIDLEPPEIFDATSESAYKNETFTFNATVTDNTVVADVYVEYWYEPGNHTNISMNATVDDCWRKNITIPSNYDALQYCIHAKDTSGNWNHTEIKSITLLERRG